MPDILIRMEMPGHCFNCSTKIDPDNRKCNIDGHVFEETLSKLTCRRDENCPLHELPPHGDLIDRDAFRAENEYYLNREFINPKYEDTLDDLLKNAPVVIPAERSGDGG